MSDEVGIRNWGLLISLWGGVAEGNGFGDSCPRNTRKDTNNRFATEFTEKEKMSNPDLSTKPAKPFLGLSVRNTNQANKNNTSITMKDMKSMKVLVCFLQPKG